MLVFMPVVYSLDRKNCSINIKLNDIQYYSIKATNANPQNTKKGHKFSISMNEMIFTLIHFCGICGNCPSIVFSINGLRTVVHTLSGRIGKVVASHAAVARSIPAEVALIYTMHEELRLYCP